MTDESSAAASPPRLKKRQPGFQKGHGYYPPRGERDPRPGTRRSHQQFTSAELREWLERLNLVPDDLIDLLGRTRQGVNLWVTGDVEIPSYVVAYLELLTAYDRLFRDRVPEKTWKAGVFKFVQEQPGEVVAHRISQRLGWPMGVVREALNGLIREGLISP